MAGTAIVDPSGDHAANGFWFGSARGGREYPAGGARLAMDVPSGSSSSTCVTPFSVCHAAMRVPSGDQIGLDQAPALWVSWRAFEPSCWMVQIWLFDP